eukprot:m.3201 g.3201  ORF g.3201 m.3201 type:complete len:168 (+) comp9130_c0_seq1:252-755(+)
MTEKYPGSISYLHIDLQKVVFACKMADDLHEIPLDDEGDPCGGTINAAVEKRAVSSPIVTRTVGRESPNTDVVETEPIGDTSVTPEEMEDCDSAAVDENEEKARLISEILELQNTLEDLSQRVQSVKEANMKFKSENQVLSQYIDNLMSSSTTFQGTSPKQFPKLKT